MGDSKRVISFVSNLQDREMYQALNWQGMFGDYLEIVRKNPRVLRSAYQRLYDMILSYGTEEYVDSKKKIIRYSFFNDDVGGGKDAIFGLDIPLQRLVAAFKSAARFYGTERRVLLLHGPVGYLNPPLCACSNAGSSAIRAPTPAPCTPMGGRSRREAARVLPATNTSPARCTRIPLNLFRPSTGPK